MGAHVHLAHAEQQVEKPTTDHNYFERMCRVIMMSIRTVGFRSQIVRP
jgi:hypothetical protein